MPSFLNPASKGPSFRSFIQSSFFLLVGVVPLVSGQTQPKYHLTPETKWMNDPQRPFLLEDEWHLYYLYNSDWDEADPGSGGTEWYHVTSNDMVHWTDQGVAIEKYKPNPPNGVVLGDVESGSSVVDAKNSAGFGENAVVAILTQMQDGVQQQSLFYSNNSGYTFTAFDGNPVMPNPGKTDFRDPKIIWDEEEGHWVIALAEGSEIGFYTSADLKTWKSASTFSPGIDLGLFECADLYQIDLDGDTASRTWILAMGANGYLHGKTTGTVYWDGTWDGTTFTPTTDSPQWMDEGPDFYATVSWENANDKYGSRYAIGWMNNWEYADVLPYYGNSQGQQSVVREVKYQTIGGTPTLVSVPIAGYDALFTNPASANGTTISTDPETASLPADLAGGAYVIQATVSKGDSDDGNEVHFRVKSDGTFNTTVGYDFADSQVFLARGNDGSATASLPADSKKVWDAVRTAKNPAGGGTVDLAIYVDYNSVEVFVNDGAAVLSALIYPNEGAEDIEVVSGSGELTLESFTYAGFAE